MPLPFDDVDWTVLETLVVFFAAVGTGHFLAIVLAGVLRLDGRLLDSVAGLSVEASWAASVLLWLRLTHRGGPSSLGLRRPKVADPLLGIAMGIGMLFASGIAAAISLAIGKAVLGTTPTTPDVTDPFRGVWMVPGFVLIVIVAPICEEILFRGLLFRGLRTRLRFAPAALVTAAVFGIVHGHPLRLLPTATGGFLLALLYERRRSLIAPITAHMTLNLIVVLVTFSRR